ncbi:MAG: type II 3-dehydroquinate dehydratase [Thalassobaculum sp.]|uniref:type II 3-dehydroquinate dehydratase n=1 Tax=Thalassobaculum sp. TaxID=2022740 RepID=UPI0032EEFF4A
MRILLIQGANMGWLGFRQPELYGTTTAAELDAIVTAEAERLGVDLEIAYTNLEGIAIDRIYEAARSGVDGLLMNPAGFLYAGYALRDCLRGVRLPYVEVHMTNIERRDMRSVLAGEADGIVVGLGIDSYRFGLEALARLIERRSHGPS